MKIKRLISFITLFVLLITPIQYAVANAEETTIVLACSDFQNESGNTAGEAVVKQLLSSIERNGINSADGFLCCGDYDYEYTDTKGGVDSLKNATKDFVNGEYVLAQGNHDSAAGTNGMSPSGNCDPANGKYGVFNINEDDYMWYNSDEGIIKNTAQNLIEYLNEKLAAEYNKPIFVISHLPLHYSMRTKNDGDGKHAKYIFDALNAAGAKGLNIIFMYGHDHSNGWDDYLGGAAVYLKKGDKILIGQNSKTVFKEETLNFTYTNPGFIGYYRNVNGADDTLTMTTWEIGSQSITVKRYSQGGIHNLKSAGVTNAYKNESGYSPDTTVYTSPQTIALTSVTDKTPIPDLVKASSSEKVNGSVYKRITNTSELQSGNQYLLVYNSSSDYIMVPRVATKSNSSGSRTGLDIIKYKDFGSNKWVDNLAAYHWTFTKEGSEWKIGTASGQIDFVQASDSINAQLSSNGDPITIGGNANAFTFASGEYYLNYNSRGVINGYRSEPAPFYIYEYTDEYVRDPESKLFEDLYYADDFTYTDDGNNVNTFVLEIDTKDSLQIVTGVPNDETPLKPGAVQTTTGHAVSAENNGKNVVAAINADFFNINNSEMIQPCGVTIKDGVKLTDYTTATGNRSYFFGIKKDGTPIIGDKSIFNSVEAQLDQAVGGGPWLVKNGNVLNTEDVRHPRTAIGYKSDGTIIMVVADGRSDISAGLTFNELAYYMKSLGAVEALNLDGGGSSTMVVENTSGAFETKNVPSDGSERDVGNTLLVLKHEYDDICDESCDCGHTRVAPHKFSTNYDDTYHWLECDLCDKTKDQTPHSYDNDCDTTCDCGNTRTATHDYQIKYDASGHWEYCDECKSSTNFNSHSYPDICVGECVCGFTTQPPHDRKVTFNTTHHWLECSKCHVKTQTASHTFTDACDTDCTCGYTRTVTHNYAVKYNAQNHWKECSICHTTKENSGHKFTNACDTGCNECDFKRTTNHVYDNAFDEICNVCDGARTAPCTPTKTFTDVKAGAWYKKYVDYSVAYGLFTGTSDTQFSPNTSMTRAQFVKVLANISGIDTNNFVNSGFKDVPSGKWFTGAIKWAADNGIVSGMGAGIFEPNSKIDRQQMCVMLVNYVEKYQKSSLKKLKVYTGFGDDDKIARWAEDAIVKCFESGLVSGTGDNLFSPKMYATRAQGATIFTNFHKEYIA